MILDQTMRLEAFMAGSASTSQPDVIVDFIDWTQDKTQTIPSPFRTTLSHATVITILASPNGISQVRDPQRVSIYNKDTVTQTITVQSQDTSASAQRIEVKQAVASGRSLVWEKPIGWYIV